MVELNTNQTNLIINLLQNKLVSLVDQHFRHGHNTNNIYEIKMVESTIQVLLPTYVRQYDGYSDSD